jgi:hypothetical protein
VTVLRRSAGLRIRGEIIASTMARLYDAVMLGEGPASTSLARPALQDAHTGHSPGMTWKGNRADPGDSVISARILTLPTCLPQTVKEVFVIFFAHVRCAVAGLVLQVPRCDRHCLVQRSAGFPVA